MVEKQERENLNRAYMEAYHAYEKTTEESQSAALLEKMRAIVHRAANISGFEDAIPEQTSAYRLHISSTPKKTIKAYKVFTLSDDGAPTALFISGTVKLPKGVWLDARDAFHFTAKNGNDYVPSTQNPYTDGGKTGASIEIPDEEVRQELIRRGFLPKGSKAKKITALAYRPGWHAGTLPFFPQGGKKAPKGSPYPNVHRYNQVVFECEIAADTDYTETARSQDKAFTKDGRPNPARADLQYLPKDGFYYYATNPLTQNNPDLGAWVISGAVKINRALTQEECDAILRENHMAPQAWEQGEMNLATIGYTSDESEAARKTLAPITYDDDGKVIPLAQRFDATIQDVRYQISSNDKKPDAHTADAALDDEALESLKKSLGHDGMQVFHAVEDTLAEGNEAVKNAASISAAILASHAKAWSEAETAAGRKRSAEDYLDTINVVANKTAEDVGLERLRMAVHQWNQTIDEYEAAEKKEWKSRRNGDLLHVMKIPLVLQTLGAPFEDLYVFGSFFDHSLKHSGMDLNLLRQLPEKLVDPLMVFRGTKSNSYVFAIELEDKNGASIVSVVEFEKAYNSSEARANIINTAFGKTRNSTDDTPSMLWFKKRIESGDVLYLNKNKSVKWFRTHENLSLTSSEALNALSEFIISDDINNVKTEEDLARIKKGHPTRYQVAYHASPYLFDSFDINQVGKGEGAQSQGFGIYVARYKKTALWYGSSFKDKRGEAHIYKVDIPSSKEMLDTGKWIQTPFVRHAIQHAYDGLTSEQKERYNRAGEEGQSRDVRTSRDIYPRFAWALGDGIRKEMTEREALERFVKKLPRPIDGDPKAASLYLRKYGIKGIVYETERDRRSYVIFNQEDIHILEREQKREGIIQGCTDFLTNGTRIVNLFEEADETTFLHETAHILYDDMLKQQDSISRKDLETVNAWAEWNEDQVEEYIDTPWYEEFKQRDKALRNAIACGDEERETALRAEWREERFARGFERYLEKGKAPTKSLCGVFKRCKQIFQNAYHAFRGRGGQASAEVEEIMGRLLTPEPITIKNKESIIFEGMKILSANVQRTEQEARRLHKELGHIANGCSESRSFFAYIEKNKNAICRKLRLIPPADKTIEKQKDFSR